MADHASVVLGPKLNQIVYADIGGNFPNSLRGLLRAIDSLVQGSVKSRTVSAPPGAPANGDAYIVGPAPTGVWAAQTDKVAVWTTQVATTDTNAKVPAWDFFTPKVGWVMYSEADGLHYAYSGSGWVTLPAPYSVAGFSGGKPGAGATVLRIPIERRVVFPINLTGSIAGLITATTGAITFTLSRNGVSIGTINFAAGATAATFTFAGAVTFSPGDYLAITAPNPQDATASDLSFNLTGLR